MEQRQFEEIENTDILVQLIRLGDYEKVRQRFTLEKDADVRIYALGEGDDDEMWDYGWIEGKNGRRIWEMEYSSIH